MPVGKNTYDEDIMKAMGLSHLPDSLWMEHLQRNRPAVNEADPKAVVDSGADLTNDANIYSLEPGQPENLAARILRGT